MDGRNSNRYLMILALVGILLLTCAGRLFYLQILHGENYRQQAEQRLVRAYPIKAPRGEIIDRHGVPFVENRMGYAVQIQKMDLGDDALNDEIVTVSKIVLNHGGELVTEFPIFYSEKKDVWGFTYTEEEPDYSTISLTGVQEEEKTTDATDEDFGEETEEKKPVVDIDKKAAEELKKEQEQKLADWKKENRLEEYQSAKDIMNYYRSRYTVAGKYTDAEALIIVAVRYDMEKSGFSVRNPYTLARDIDMIALQQIKEQSMSFPGVEVEIEPVRVYTGEKTAAHLLGRTGIIYAEEYQELKEKGYGMTDIIGKEGLEKLLEPYLKGTDGYKSVSMSKNGGVTEILQSQAVKPGNYAKLTLDLELQQAMERSLEENITAAVDRNGAGGAIAIIPGTGEVLAMASYPSYNPDTFDKDYEKLVQAKSKPLINRALNGTYSPGSTFKPLTAIAGLETGVIKPDTYIVDRGKYTYFDSYQPTCLIYSSTGSTHGTIEVSEALGVSCNYFFYEVGRLVGIEDLNHYAKDFGLGEPTGIELGESKGLMANPDHRKELGEEWYPGDVIQTAIGQSDTLFTPAQLANYIATLLNKGTRYRLHLIDEVVDYDTGEAVIKNEPEVVAKNTIKDSTFEKVVDGMRQVVTYGTAKSAFVGADYKAAGKTGTAEVPDGADNVLFVGFAPYENPEIVVAVVIEHGAKSTYAAQVARDIFDAYMELKELRENPTSAASRRRQKETKSETEEKPKSSNAPVPTGKANADQGKAPVETVAPPKENELGEGGTL